MSLFESGHSTGMVSLALLLDGAPQPGVGNGMTVPDLMRRIVVGRRHAIQSVGVFHGSSSVGILRQNVELHPQFRIDHRLEEMLDRVRNAGIAIKDLSIEEPDLEDVFVDLTSSEI